MSTQERLVAISESLIDYKILLEKAETRIEDQAACVPAVSLAHNSLHHDITKLKFKKRCPKQLNKALVQKEVSATKQRRSKQLEKTLSLVSSRMVSSAIKADRSALLRLPRELCELCREEQSSTKIW